MLLLEGEIEEVSSVSIRNGGAKETCYSRTNNIVSYTSTIECFQTHLSNGKCNSFAHLPDWPPSLSEKRCNTATSTRCFS